MAGMAKSDPDDIWRPLLLAVLVPFALPMAVTLLLAIVAGDRFPRDLAAGSSLALHGFAVTILVASIGLLSVSRRLADPQARKFALLLSGLVSLMAWPVWTIGALPSVNGMMLGQLETTTMRLKGLEETYASSHRQFYHWARLEPDQPGSPLGAGRYFILPDTYERWRRTAQSTTQVRHATGLLGAEVVRAYE